MRAEAIAELKAHAKDLTYQQFSTLRGQIYAGDIEGAKKGLKNILEKKK